MTPQEYIRSRADAVFNGEANAATVYAELYALSKELESAIATVKEQAITEVKQYGREGLTSNGYNFTTSNAGGRWNYSGVSVLTSLTERIKKVQEMAQVASKTGAGVFDPDTGELIEPAVYIAGSEAVKATRDNGH